MFFNAFEISAERDPGFWFFSFGYLDRLDVFDQYHCIVSDEAVGLAIPGMRQYIGEVGLPSPGFENRGMPSLMRPVPIEPIDLIGVSRRNIVGEISFHCFSWHRVYEASQMPPPEQTTSAVNADTAASRQAFAFNVCLLRSSLDVHRTWLLELIGEYDARRGNA